ncbi:hypothetical protein ADUPG1_013783 [Aduncisulcus paluster]|uniref:Uncharacterized protein n=1 Tax=Aduncisulcus paluster TaxID=2918883 RepID=A0ABQ5K7F0_9EUKA|nr:hypothetical protein ADUPG1_013783 [Aduncisulcus paluster]
MCFQDKYISAIRCQIEDKTKHNPENPTLSVLSHDDHVFSSFEEGDKESHFFSHTGAEISISSSTGISSSISASCPSELCSSQSSNSWLGSSIPAILILDEQSDDD